jgi:hypothetical protein
MGEVIEPAGCDLTNFRRHPIALFAHRPDYVVGTWENIAVEGNRLLGDLNLLPPDASPQAKLVRENIGVSSRRSGFRSPHLRPLRRRVQGADRRGMTWGKMPSFPFYAAAEEVAATLLHMGMKRQKLPENV